MNSYHNINTLKLPKIINQRLNIRNTPKNNYFLNILKISKIKRENSENSKDENNKSNKNINDLKKDDLIILNISKKKKNKKNNLKKKEKKKSPKNHSSFSFKNVFNTINKNRLQKSFSSLNVNTIEKEKPNLESNFMKLKNESNIYTSNAHYITNKKMIIIDKYLYDNNIYRPDRLGLFDMSDFRRPKLVSGRKIIGKIYYNHNKFRNDKENINNIYF